MVYSKKQIERFWSNVKVGERDECWPWLKSKTANGYGQVGLTINGKPRVLKAHKVAFEIHTDSQLFRNDRATHACGNKDCCNPLHVTVCKAVEAKTQGVRGEQHGNARLTESQVRLIKYRLTSLTNRELADLFHVSIHTIWDLRKGITWRHV